MWLHSEYNVWVCDCASHWCIIACKKKILFVPIFTFSRNPSTSCPNYFDRPSSRGLLFFSLVCIKYLYCNISHICALITVLLKYQGKGSYSIYVAMLCASIGIGGAIWFISSCVAIGTLLGATLVGLPGFLFSCFYLGPSLGATLGGLSGVLLIVFP